MRSRRAISSVVGMVFAIIALTTTITYISYSMGILNNYNQSVLTQNQQLTNVGMEKFQIASVTVPNGKLNVTVVNTGNLPINFTKIWIQNTTTTDWIHSYSPTNNFASSGGVLTNIGQNIPVSINPANSYNVKLVTSRGNTQSFTVNSISSTKLNVQLYAFPPNIASGLSSQIVMIITNNSTGPIVNLTPTASVSPIPPGPPNCALGSVSPSKANTLLPGGTVVFTWPITITGASVGQMCTVTAQLPNGQTFQTTVSVTQIGVTSAIYATYAGTLTMDYTQFQFTEGGTWNTDWQITGGAPLAFSIKITNNNATSDFYIAKQSFFWLSDPRNGDKFNKNFFYIVDGVNLNSSPMTVNAYCKGIADNCDEIPYNGSSTTIYLGASSAGAGGNNVGEITQGENYAGFIILYGKFVNHKTGYTEQYGQNIPFVAILGI